MIGGMRFRSRRQVHIALAVAVVIAFLLIVPIVQADTATDQLKATIRSVISSDPRASSMSASQLDALVSTLTQEATRRGVTSRDITWRPQPLTTFGNKSEAFQPTNLWCGGIPSYLCSVDMAFGFAGPDSTIPLFLLAASMGLVWVIGSIMHGRHVSTAAVPSTTTQSY